MKKYEKMNAYNNIQNIRKSLKRLKKLSHSCLNVGYTVLGRELKHLYNNIEKECAEIKDNVHK
uniref:Uncharacterized protein n=1 Tax=viral metagenome TaxID=1070528 RepID=A0A6M3LIF0_9ZZZZ